MIKEFKIFLTAIMFLTRLPCCKWVEYDEINLNKSSKYFSLVGIIVGAFAALIYYLSDQLFSFHIAILLSMIATIILTGAFHEDGFADVCDAFGGGTSKEQILKIMKDPQIGSYGAIGIVLILLFKYLILIEISPSIIIYTLIAGHSLSRFCAASVIFTHQYSRKNDNTSKTKPITSKMSLGGLILLALFGILPIILLGYKYLLLIIPVFIVRELAISYFKQRIDGYTGDCLGAIQQLTEITFYIFILLDLWKYF